VDAPLRSPLFFLSQGLFSVAIVTLVFLTIATAAMELPLLLLAALATLVQATPTPPPARGADPVCIVGAGPAGLAAAKALEAKGLEVVLFEKRPDVGGKCQSQYEG
jgi:NADPH-dependent 2,4-dienoyl-CoA reductase/sulfur reductase-like enzyme